MVRSIFVAIVTGAVLLLTGCSTKQADYLMVNPPEPVTEGDRWVIIDSMPSMIGGDEALLRHLVYPPEARQAGVEGEVILQYIVHTDGTPVDIKVVKSLDANCDAAAIHALKQVNFKPGMQRGQPVRVQLYTTVHFKI
jgi:protein TonB